MAEHKIIKARDLESSGASVEKLNLGLRKFKNNVFKHVSLDEQPVAMEDEAPVPEFPDAEGAADGDEHQVRIERFYGDDGELTGLQITCRCGEVIDLEFTREDDETLPESPPLDEEPEVERADSVEATEPAEAEVADVVEAEAADEQALPEQEQDTVEEASEQETEASEQEIEAPEQETVATEQEIEEKPQEEQILVDNQPETTEIEEN